MAIPSIIPTNKVYFAVQVLDQLDGKKLRALRPDENGYYQVVLAMLDATSRNNAYYDVDSLVREINEPSSVFNQTLTQGNLRGEWGHPPMDSTLERIQTIDESRISHHISRLWTGDRTERGIPLYGSIRPSGPFKQVLEDSLLNPKENTTFSLRCLMKQRVDAVNKRMHRTVTRLVTFDYVNMPGYMEASKWFAPGTESFNGYMTEITPDQIFDDQGKIVGLESWSDQELADLFGVHEVQIGNLRMSAYRSGTGTYYDERGNKRSAVHAMLRTQRR